VIKKIEDIGLVEVAPNKMQGKDISMLVVPK